jgi:hypothetical protein
MALNIRFVCYLFGTNCNLSIQRINGCIIFITSFRPLKSGGYHVFHIFFINY